MNPPLLTTQGDSLPSGRIQLDTPARSAEHLDLSQITVSDLDGITINRTKTGISPFVPIHKTPTFSQHSGTHSGFAVEIEDDSTPTGFRHVGTVSKNYLLLSNEEVRELAIEIALRSGMPFKESRIFWDGSRFCHIIDFVDHSEAVVPGDEIGLSLITQSSYDRTWKYRCCLAAKRWVCDNGAISGEFFADVSFKHITSDGDPKEDSWQQIVRQAMSVIDQAPENLHSFVEAMRAMKSTRMTDGRLREVWKALPTLGDSVKGQIISRYVDAEEDSLYGLFQAGTWLFSHREKMTASDFLNNDTLTTTMLRHVA